ncbi:MAG: hypothetical protein OCU17_07185 [Methanophagales archaeon]|nr:hypothetical protein [Methanophagales archaeon]
MTQKSGRLLRLCKNMDTLQISLIDNYESHESPTHNTQLEILLWLVEEQEIKNYDRIALAIALDYGAVLAISEEMGKMHIITIGVCAIRVS